VSITDPSAPADSVAATDLIDRGTGGLAARAGRGVVLTLSSQWLRLVLQVAATVVIARMLSPNDYGLVGMVAALTGFADQLRELGLSDASVQRDRLTRAQLDALFWVNTALGLGFTILFCAGSPLIAAFYHRPELVAVSIVLSLNFIAGGLSVQHSALLRRRLRFGRLAVSEIVPMAVSIVVGIAAAQAGARYWALVAMYLTQSYGRLLVLWWRADWWPGRPRRAHGLRELLSFGADLSFFNVLNYISRNFDNVLIGRYRGAVELGLYTRAYSLLMLPLRQLNTPIMRVAVPTLAGLRGEPARFRAYFRSALVGLAVIGMPVVVVLAVLSREIVDVLLGRQYSGTAPIFQVLAIAGVAQIVSNPSGWLFVASGRTRQMAHWGMINSPLIVVAFLIGLPDGALGVARAYAVATLVLMVPGFWLATRGTPVSMIDIGAAVWRPAVLAGGVFAASLATHAATTQLPDVARIAIVSAAAVAAWFAGLAAWGGLRRDVMALVNALRRGMAKSPGVAPAGSTA
jgi:O-antigen/teichoic acid export membrane protein